MNHAEKMEAALLYLDPHCGISVVAGREKKGWFEQ